MYMVLVGKTVLSEIPLSHGFEPQSIEQLNIIWVRKRCSMGNLVRLKITSH